MYTVKLNPDRSLARLKSRLIIKKYSQVYGMDYQHNFLPVTKLMSVRILISLIATHQWLFIN